MTYSKKTKEYLRSSLITFLTGFAIAILPVLETIDLENIETSLIIAGVLTSVRAGIKAVIEYFISIEKKS